jgi:transposase
MSDHKGARLILDALPPAKALLADRGYDRNWFRDALAKRGCKPCIPSTKSRKIPRPYDKALYKQRHKIENMFARLKDWRRIATRYDRCAHTFFSSICIAATLAFYLNGHSPDGADPSPILAPIGSLGKLDPSQLAKDRPRIWYRPHPALKNGDLSVIWTHVPREFVPNP